MHGLHASMWGCGHLGLFSWEKGQPARTRKEVAEKTEPDFLAKCTVGGQTVAMNLIDVRHQNKDKCFYPEDSQEAVESPSAFFSQAAWI